MKETGREESLRVLSGLKSSLAAQLQALRSADLDEIMKSNKKCSRFVSELADKLKGEDAQEFARANRTELIEIRKLLNLNQALLSNLIKTSSSFQQALVSEIADRYPGGSGALVSVQG